MVSNSIYQRFKVIMDGKEFKILLPFLLSLIFLSSLTSSLSKELLLLNLLFTMFFIISANCLLGDLKLFYLSIGVGIIAIFSTWFVYLKDLKGLWLVLQYGAYVLFFCLMLLHILKMLFEVREINLNIIFAAMSGYIFMGFITSFLMMIVNIIYPNAYLFYDERPLEYFDFIYGGFVHLTTLGLGDIVPKINPAKGLTIIQTLIGQLYLTVIMAIMVGKYLTKQTK